MPALLARHRLFVLPSQTEGISLTLLEAQARGLPVVATAVGGSPEVVATNTTGLLVPAKRPRRACRCHHEIGRRWPLGHEMGKAGRARVEKYFDIKTMTRQYEALYACMS